MLHELVPMLGINTQSHVKKSTKYLFKWQITIYLNNEQENLSLKTGKKSWKNPGISYLEKSGNPVSDKFTISSEQFEIDAKFQTTLHFERKEAKIKQKINI